MERERRDSNPPFPTVEVKAPGERFDPSLEAAAYFIACEGLTNAVKHAQATKVVLSAARRNGRGEKGSKQVPFECFPFGSPATRGK